MAETAAHDAKWPPATSTPGFRRTWTRVRGARPVGRPPGRRRRRPASITGLADLERLPFPTKTDSATATAWLDLVSESDVARIDASSGTTGKRTFCAYTRNVHHLADQFAAASRWPGHPGRPVQVILGTGSDGRAGFQAVPSASADGRADRPGDLELQLEMMLDFESPSSARPGSALSIAETVEARGRAGSCVEGRHLGSERWAPEVRERIGGSWHRGVDIYG